MGVTRTAAASMAAITAALGLSLATAGPAAAASSGAWAEYGDKNPITSSTSTWRCASTVAITTNVGAQVCAVRSQSGISVQGAVIVRNNRGLAYSVTAETDLFGTDSLGKWVCQPKAVKADSWAVCFGETIRHNFPVDAQGYANNKFLSISPLV